MAEALKEPEMSEAENPNSIGQGEIYTQNIPKNNKQKKGAIKEWKFLDICRHRREECKSKCVISRC